ncbi:uncharacterized protein [Temnothorax longispinosus]|uniref:uncharacterized protein n=1 Tax=Temnothorax longispinosus TaxID=300112 RepID=UPI003A9A5ECD
MFTKIRKRLRKFFSRNNNNVPSSLTFDDPTVWYQLTYVNLSNCSGITTLPKELGALPHLEKLVLSNNGFGVSVEFKWHWLQQTAIQNNLRFLDLSKNSLTELPACIGKLSALTELIVCHNSLRFLPRDLGTLPHLEKLVLSNNGFGASHEFEWHWLQQTAIQNNLRFLDLSKNSLMIVLPACIGKLSALTELIVCHNSLRYLPQSIGNLRNLRFLRSSNNKLFYLPGSMMNMQLETLDVSTNDFLTLDGTLIFKELTLRTLAAKVVLKNRSTYRKERDNIPPELFKQFESLETETNYCLHCNRPCLDSYITEFTRLNPLCIANTTILDTEENEILSFQCYFCSPDCREKSRICNIWLE